VDTQGDAFFVAFARAADALAAASDAQAALAGGPIRVRMGLHTGEPLVTDEGYVGIDVHRAARIAAAGYGGQVLVSQSTRELVTVDGLLDLGEHRLKDFAEPVALFQLGDATFPPLKTVSNTNLPRPSSSFVGRAREIDEIRATVRGGSRLLTLTGPGGAGKTRLAIEGARTLVPEFKAGVFWVALADVRGPALLPDLIGRAIGTTDDLAKHIAERRLLLLLDNFEHVVEAAPELTSLLEVCPNLFVLVTSRELLRVRGEVEYPVRPLAAREAVELFYARARTEPDRAVDELCLALDNLPLALELAAARSKVLSPRQILERVSERLDLFKGGRDLDPRQQTLRATIDWSYDLLASEERRLFARLAIFSRGCTLEAAEHVASADLDTLQSLVDKNLVRHSGERFSMLETIRESAAERLRDSGDLADMARRHAGYYRHFAEDGGAELHGSSQGESLERIEEDLENVRGAFRWSIEDGDCDLALSIVVSLERFWSAQGRTDEVLALIESALERGGDSIDEELRARALWIAGFQAVRARQPEKAAHLYEEALELFRERPSNVYVRCLSQLSMIRQDEGLDAESAELAERALAVALELDDPVPLSDATYGLAILAYRRGDHARAVELYEDCLGLRRKGGDPSAIAVTLYNLGLAARALGDQDRAERAFEEALNAATRAGHVVLMGSSATNLGFVMLSYGEYTRARSLGRQGLDAFSEIRYATETAEAINLMAAIAAGEGDDRNAARLWGAADALLDVAGTQLDDIDAKERERFELKVRSSLGSSRFEAAAAEGRRLSLEDVVQLVKAQESGTSETVRA
jgi:predicted ATPase